MGDCEISCDVGLVAILIVPSATSEVQGDLIRLHMFGDEEQFYFNDLQTTGKDVGADGHLIESRTEQFS